MTIVAKACAGIALALLLAAAPVCAQVYPNKPITVTIGLAAGSGADVLVRH